MHALDAQKEYEIMLAMKNQPKDDQECMIRLLKHIAKYSTNPGSFTWGENSLFENLYQITIKNPSEMKKIFVAVKPFFQLLDNGLLPEAMGEPFCLSLYAMLRAGNHFLDSPLFYKIIECCSIITQYTSHYDEKLDVIKELFQPESIHFFLDNETLQNILTDTIQSYSSVSQLNNDRLTIYITRNLSNHTYGYVHNFNFSKFSETIRKDVEFYMDYVFTNDDIYNKSIVLHLSELDFSDKIKAAFGNDNIPGELIPDGKDCVERLLAIDYEFFESIHEPGRKNAFTECLDAILDSDTLPEVDNRLKALERAYAEYKNGKDYTQEDVVKDVSSGQYREVVDGKLISYSAFQNMPDRPNNILERNDYLVKQILDYPISVKDFYDRLSEDFSLGELNYEYVEEMKKLSSQKAVTAIEDTVAPLEPVEKASELDKPVKEEKIKTKRFFGKKQ